MRKRTKSEAESEEYVCSMDTEVPTPLQNIFSQKLRKNDSLAADHVTGQRVPGKGYKVC